MVPVRLILRNFLSYRDTTEVDFSGIHLACLSGDNGHGKSALLDAITWALWGKARTDRDDELVHLGPDGDGGRVGVRPRPRSLSRASEAAEGRGRAHWIQCAGVGRPLPLPTNGAPLRATPSRRRSGRSSNCCASITSLSSTAPSLCRAGPMSSPRSRRESASGCWARSWGWATTSNCPSAPRRRPDCGRAARRRCARRSI